MKKIKVNEFTSDVNPYEVDKLSKIPFGIIILILKFWAAAAAVFFGTMDSCMFTVSEETNNSEALLQTLTIIVFVGLLLSLIMNYAIRPIVRMAHNRRNNCYKFHMVNMKGFKSFLLSLPYYMIISLILYHTIVFLGEHNLIFNPFGNTTFGIEPFTYGLCFIIVDIFFVTIKNLIIMLVQRYIYYKQINAN